MLNLLIDFIENFDGYSDYNPCSHCYWFHPVSKDGIPLKTKTPQELLPKQIPEI
jgi:hypothetical protein